MGELRVVVMCRDSQEGRRIACAIDREGLLAGVVVESGGQSDRAKARATLRRTPARQRPRAVADLAALALYRRYMSWRVRSAIGAPPAFPSAAPRVDVDDANSTASIAAITAFDPDVLLVSGTSILGREVLAVPARHALNVHGGIVPRYRNVHCEFWAVFNRDRENLGVTVLHLDERVDAGAIAIERRLAPPANQLPLPRVKAALIGLGAEAAVEAARLAADDALAAHPQAGPATLHPRPGLAEITRLAARGWR